VLSISARNSLRLLISCAIGIVLFWSEAQAQPSADRVAQATVLSTSPVIDGDVLGDPAWEGAQAITGFSQVRPDAGRAATQKTDVYVGFTATTMHVAVVAHDTDPDAIFATDSRRDSSLDDTDAFLFVVDGLLDRQNGYVFGTNPAGMQFDGQVAQEGTGGFAGFGGAGFNKNWDAPWTVATTVGDFGWSAEFEIPLTTLRFGSAEDQQWGFNFQRNIRRNYEVAYWAPLSQEHNLYRVSDAGTISGIRVPKQRNLQITPYVLGKTQQGGDLPNRNNESEVGFDVKYSITPSLTLDATYNTDFAQVEADDQQINLDRFSLFFPEKRPFFLENAGQFTVGNSREVELFFSRRIGIGDSGEQSPIDGGLRLSGKVGSSTNVGLLHMSSEAVAGFAPGNQFSVARVNQELANRSGIGFIAVNRQGDGSHILSKDLDENQTYAIDGRWGVGDNILFEGWYGKTDTPGRTGDDEAYAVKANYNSPKWSFNLEHTEIGGDFNPEVGFLSRTEYVKDTAFAMYRWRPDDLWGLFELRPHIRYSEHQDFQGVKESANWHIDNHWEFKNGYLFETGTNMIYERVETAFELVPGVIVQPGVYDEQNAHFVVRTNQAAPLSLNVRSNLGGAWGGDRFQTSPSIKYRIGDTFSSELSINYNKFDLPIPNGDFSVALTRLRLSYSFTPNMLLQALFQYNERSDKYSTNLRFSWLQSASSGLYVVYNEVDEQYLGAPPKGKEFIIKYSRIFDMLD
jgi:hypothetical protein